MRPATADDIERVVQFNNSTMADDAQDAIRLGAFVRDLIAPTHPTCGPSHFSLIEDTRSQKIVSSMCLIPQTWSYAGIAFGVGQLEVVSTDPAYRRRGLIRTQFEYWHAQSAALGHRVQVVDGILWYYRQFGYEYAIEHFGGRVGYYSATPGLKEGESEPYRLRPMRDGDLPLVMSLFERDSKRSLVSTPRPAELWRYLMSGYSRDSFEFRHYHVIETPEGAPMGYVVWFTHHDTPRVRVTEFVAVDGQSLRALALPVLRALQAEAVAAEGPGWHADRYYLCMGRTDPLYDAIPEVLTPGPRPYAWYVRVADVPGFLRHIAPALEARLAASALAGYTGELKISDYQRGFRMAFERGTLTAAEPYQPPQRIEGAAFPPLVFLQLLFGYRSLAELRAAFPDCMARDEAAVLLDVLFPRQDSNVISIT
jgi:hypothetical protein